jgi:bisphosphoglycerate-independent phosphoglycerate mutase (AlkP superfamily)
VLVAPAWRDARLRDGSLADVAPTVCELLELAPPPSMTGHSLIIREPVGAVTPPL